MKKLFMTVRTYDQSDLDRLQPRIFTEFVLPFFDSMDVDCKSGSTATHTLDIEITAPDDDLEDPSSILQGILEAIMNDPRVIGVSGSSYDPLDGFAPNPIAMGTSTFGVANGLAIEAIRANGYFVKDGMRWSAVSMAATPIWRVITNAVEVYTNDNDKRIFRLKENV